MKLILGLAGHPDTNNQVEGIIRSNFDNIEVLRINITDDTDIDIIRDKSSLLNEKCTGVLFTDLDLYHLFHSRVKINIISTYLEDYKPEILKTLFKSKLREDTDVTNISIDSITYDEVKRIYDALEFTEQHNCRILTVPFELSGSGLVERITSAHKENYDKFGCTCITFFTETKKQLESMNVPVLRVGINKDEVIEKVNKLTALRAVKPDDSRSMVAIVIILSGLKEHLILDNTEHNVVAEYNRISEAVFWFSEKIDGAYIPNDQRKYIIFCEKDAYEKATDGSINIEVLNEVSKKNYFTCSVGIGYGRSAREAVKNATIAQIKASKNNRSSAYIMYEKGLVIGPIYPSADLNTGSNPIYDMKINEIASRSRIGVNTIYRLFNMVKKSGETDYTSRDISEYLGITIRSANRLFEKLTQSNYIKLVGKKSTGEKGRPIRVFRFLF